MSEATQPCGETLSIGQALRVNGACDRFEAAWAADDRPRIEDALAGVADGQERRSLLRELIALEVELRREAGERPDENEYRGRFADDPEVVDAVFCGLEPDAIGDYELLGELGRGGMGVVYRARQASANRLVALKVMRSGRLATDDEARRFRVEAEAAANLDHPNLVPIYEVGCWRGLHYFSMKLVEGGSLATHARAFRDDPRAAARLIARVARAVHHAHSCGFVHRDLKPGNILLGGPAAAPPTEREPMVTDFGLVKRVGTAPDDGEAASRSGKIVGTLEYMAPEQAAGGEVGPAADVYGLGATLYALLAGRPPFRASTPMETLVQVNEKDPDPPHRLNPTVPADLELVCLRCLEKDPTRRYPTAEALADDLDRYLRDEPVDARRTGTFGRLRRWARREPELAFRLVGIGAVTLLTQANYFFVPAPIRRLDLHWEVTGAELLWMLAVVVLQRLSRREGRAARLRPLWVVVDVAALTALLRLLGAADTVLVVGYPLLVAASGLWSRVRLVWLTAGLSAVGYAAIWTETVLRSGVREPHYLNIVVASLLVAALIVSHQVRRFWALSRYYEHRPSPR